MSAESNPKAPQLEVNLGNFDLDAYRQLAQYEVDVRPYENDQGEVFTSEGELLDAPDEYLDNQRDIHKEETTQDAYEDMGMLELARKLAKAEVIKDRTTMRNINDVLLDKMIDFSEEAMSSTDLKEGTDAGSVITDRVMSYKDNYKATLTEDGEEPPASENLPESSQLLLEAGSDDAEAQSTSEDLNAKAETLMATIAATQSEINQTKQQQTEELKNQQEQLDLRTMLKKYGIRDSGLVAVVNDNYKLSTKRRIVDAHMDKNGEEAFTVEVIVNDPNSSEPATVHTFIETGSQLLSNLKDSDKRMFSGKYLKDMSQDEKIDPQIDIDREGAERRDSLRAYQARGERKAAGKITWRDKISEALNNRRNDDKESKDKKRGLVVAAMGLGILAVGAYAVNKGFISHDHLNALSSSGAGDHATDVIDKISNSLSVGSANAATPDAASTASSIAPNVVHAFHDTVNSGDGITNSIMDYAQAHGQNITPDQAYQIFQNTPTDLLDTISNTSPQSVTGGIGYNGPGPTTIPPEVIERWNELLSIK